MLLNFESSVELCQNVKILVSYFNGNNILDLVVESNHSISRHSKERKV